MSTGPIPARQDLQLRIALRGCCDQLVRRLGRAVALGALGHEIVRGPKRGDARPRAQRAATGVREHHGVGILHRDLKPAKIFLVRGDDGGESPRVLDLGVAKQVTADGAGTRPTTLGALLGTPRYMAPEQLVAAGAVDERADVWALGAILYEAVAGQPHVQAHRPAHVLRAIAAGLTPLRDVAPSAPPSLSELAMRMLAVDRRQRPTAAAALRGA